MNSLVIALIAYVGFILAYRFYGKFLSQKIFALDPDRVTPAHEFEDGVDYVPTKKEVLLGHHFTSIAGAAPIVGPAIAVIWGWLPALLWVVLGSILMGAVHDLGALVISARHKGKSVSSVIGELVGPRAKILFLLLTFFALLIVVAVFAMIIALLFSMYPASVLPIWIEIPVAVAIGYWIYKGNGNATVAGIVGIIVLYIFVIIGTYVPISIPEFSFMLLGINVTPLLVWIVILLVYAYIASTLPVWVLLQPRDYINSHELYVALILMFAGLAIGMPKIVAPAINTNAAALADAPSFIPFLFITIACGAISGFHSMVASGTTVKQLDKETDAYTIGYGGMLLEGVLAVMAILACTAGFASLDAWNTHYAGWGAANGLGAKVGAFVAGGANFVSNLGIPTDIALTILAVMVVSFAATTLDSATRIQRYIVAELAESINLKPLTTKHGATLFAVLTAFGLTLIDSGRGGMRLWPLFGASNQLMAGLALLVVSVWLLKIKKPSIYTLIPMIFMVIVTSWALVANFMDYLAQGNMLLTVLDGLIFLLEIWVVIESVITIQKTKADVQLNQGM